MKTKLFTLFFALVASVGTMFAWDYEHILIGNLYYNLDTTNFTAQVTYDQWVNENNYSGLESEITIPTSVSHNDTLYKVTSIGKNAFALCGKIMQVEIPNSITEIGIDAFYNSRITSIRPLTVNRSLSSEQVLEETLLISCTRRNIRTILQLFNQFALILIQFFRNINAYVNQQIACSVTAAVLVNSRQTLTTHPQHFARLRTRSNSDLHIARQRRNLHLSTQYRRRHIEQ